MTDYTELKRLAQRVIDIEALDGGEPIGEAWDEFEAMATPSVVLPLIAENERLQSAERTLIHLGYTDNGGELWKPPLGKKPDFDLIDQLKAENEALRDDLEQVQYEADAWRNQEESLWVEVYRSEGDDPFISAVQGSICIDELIKIQGVFLQYPEEYFEHGSGLYVFRCGHHEAHYDNVGMTEPAHWEIEFESHSRFPWADEKEPMIEEAGND